MHRVNQPYIASRRRLLATALALLPGSASWARAPASLPTPFSLEDELRLALAQGQPLVVLASLEGCAYCKLVREQHLVPLRERGHLPVLQLDLRSPRELLDFAGRPSSHEMLLRAWNVRLAPTLLFFGRGGVEIAPRLKGMGLPDFYGAYLDERLAQARKALKA